MADEKEDILKKALRKVEDAQKTAAQTPAQPAAAPAPKEKTRLADPGATVVNKIVDEITSGDVTVQSAKTGYTNIANAVKWIWNSRPVRWPRKAYMALWHATDHKARKNPVVKKLAKFLGRPLLYLFTASTLASTAGFIVPDTATGGKAIDAVASTLNYVSWEPLYDGTRMAVEGTNKHVVCLNSAQEIDHVDAIYSVSGNVAGKPETVDNALYSLMKPSLMHTFWNVAHGHFAFFNPTEVQGPIVDGGSHPYEVVDYGYRWRVGSLLQGYNYLLDAKRLPDDPKVCFNGAAGPGQQAPANQSQAPARTIPPAMTR